MAVTRTYQDAIDVIEREIGRLEKCSEYSEHSKVESMIRAKQLLIETRKGNAKVRAGR